MRFFKTSAVLAIISLSFTLASADPLPLIIYGGIGADRNAREIAQLLRVLTEEMGFNSTDDIAFFRTDLYPGMPINAFGACEYIKGLQNFNEAKEYNMIGVSQGGLNARHVLEECDTPAKARNFITLGTPNMGITEAGQAFPDHDMWTQLAYQFAYYSVAEWAFAAAGYFRDTRSADTYQEYLKNSWFLARINNENDHTSTAAL